MPPTTTCLSPSRALQPIDVADAVLQADDDGAGLRMPGDQAGHLLRRPALDGDQDDVGPCEGRGRIAGQLDGAGSQRAVGAVEVGNAHAVAPDRLRQGRPQQERHAPPRQRQAAADIAADAAGPRHGNDRLRAYPRRIGRKRLTCIIMHVSATNLE